MSTLKHSPVFTNTPIAGADPLTPERNGNANGSPKSYTNSHALHFETETARHDAFTAQIASVRRKQFETATFKSGSCFCYRSRWFAGKSHCELLSYYCLEKKPHRYRQHKGSIKPTRYAAAVLYNSTKLHSATYVESRAQCARLHLTLCNFISLYRTAPLPLPLTAVV